MRGASVSCGAQSGLAEGWGGPEEVEVLPPLSLELTALSGEEDGERKEAANSFMAAGDP